MFVVVIVVCVVGVCVIVVVYVVCGFVGEWMGLFFHFLFFADLPRILYPIKNVKITNCCPFIFTSYSKRKKTWVTGLCLK